MPYAARLGLVVGLTAVAVLFAPVSVSAQTSTTWTGAAGSNWNNAGNWTAGVPNGTSITDILFNSSSTANLTNTNDLGGLALNKITIANPTGSVVINGNALGLGAGGIDLTTATASLRINTPLTLTAAQSWNVNSGRTLTIAGGVSGSGALTLNGVSGATGTVVLTGTNTFSAPLTLARGGLRLGSAGVAGTVNVDVVNNGTMTFALAGAQGYSNAISGTGSVTVQGISGVTGPTGSLTLSGANTYTGTTSVSDAAVLTLDFSAAGAPLNNVINNGRTSANVAAGNGSALALGGLPGGSNTASTTVSVIGTTSTVAAGNTQDFRSLTVNPGAATIAVTAAASHTTTLNLNAITRGARGTVDFAPSGAGTVVITTTTANTAAGILGGWATFTRTDWATSSSSVGPFVIAAFGDYFPTWFAGLNTNVPTAGLTGVTGDTNSLRFAGTAGNVTLDPSTATTPASVTSGGVLVAATVAGPVQISGGALTAGTLDAPNELIIHQHSTADTLTIGSVIANNGTGTTSLTKVGSGTLRLTGANTYTGVTAVLGGVLELETLGNAGAGNPANPLGQSSNSAANLILDGGTLRYVGSANGSTDRRFTLGPGGATLDAAGTGTFTIGTDSTGAATGSGNRTLVLTGTGTGTLVARLDNPSNGVTSLTKIGSGTWSLTGGSNNYGGPTTILGGVLAATVGIGNGGSPGSLGQSSAAASNLVIDGGTLRWTGNRNDTARLFTVGPNGATIESSGGSNSNFSFTNTGPIAFGGTGPASLTLGGTTTATSAFAPAIGDAGASGPTSVIKTGTNTWFLIGVNTYTGGTAIRNGTVVLGTGSGHLGPGPVTIGDATANTGGTLQLGTTASVTLGSGSTIPGVIGAATQTIASLQSAGTGTNRVVGGFTSVSTLTIDTPVGVTATFGGTLGGTGTNNNNLALVKSGAGTQVLTGANTYNGGTTITGGTLLANGQSATQSAVGTGPVAVLSGGTLGGNGRIAPNPAGSSVSTGVLSGGTITAGTAAASPTLTVVNGLALQDGSRYRVRLFGTGTTDIGQLAVTGLVMIDPTASVTLDLSAVDANTLRAMYPSGQTYTVLTGTTVTGAFGGIDTANSNLGNFSASEWSLALAPPTGSVQLVFNPVPVPEPVTVLAWAVAGFGAAGLVRRLRRRSAVTVCGGSGLCRTNGASGNSQG